MKRNDDLAPGDAEQVACQGVTLPWVSTVGERQVGHTLVQCTIFIPYFSGQIRCLLIGVQLLSLHTVRNWPAAPDSAVQLLYTCTLGENLGKPSRRDELSVVPQVVLFGEKQSHYSRCSSLEQMLIVAGHSMCRDYTGKNMVVSVFRFSTVAAAMTSVS